jgi:hypothetical protein
MISHTLLVFINLMDYEVKTRSNYKDSNPEIFASRMSLVQLNIQVSGKVRPTLIDSIRKNKSMD